jgi:hypothetical protein
MEKMFKVGDKVKLKDRQFNQYYVYISPEKVYEVDCAGETRIALKGIKQGYYLAKEFELVEEEEVKMLKVEVKETTKEVTQKFPCIRKGKTTGKLYLFHSEKYGYCLENQTFSSWEHTEPFTGTVTLTQE